MTTYAQFRDGILHPPATKVRKPTPPFPKPRQPYPTGGAHTPGINPHLPPPSRRPPMPPHHQPPTPGPTGTPAHPPTPMDPFQAWYMTDPRYLLQHPLFEQQRGSIYAQYGWQPNGAGGYTQTPAAQNPSSLVNQLAQALAGQSQQVQNNANAHGLLFSGAQVQGQQNAASAADKSLKDAQMAFQNALRGVTQNESDLVNQLYPEYLKTAPPAGAKPAAPAASPGKPGLTVQQEADRKARVAKAQAHLKQDKIDAANRRKRKRRTRPKERPGAGMTGGIAGGGA